MSNSIISGNIVSDLNDHFSQFCIVTSICQERKKQKLNKIRDFSQYSQTAINNDLLLTLRNYSYANEANNVNKRFSTIYNKINKLINKHAPLKVIKT